MSAPQRTFGSADTTRREFLRLLGAGAAGTVLSSRLLWAGSEPARQPNIVLIYADDLGYGDVGCYGATKVKTPNIDRLAREGVRFTDAHAASAVCTPSRYALLTGEYPWRINCWSPIFHRAGLIIQRDQLTVAKLLKQHGYDTACIGKWHLGFGEKEPDWNGDLKPGPLEVGFDYYYGVPIVSSHPPFVYVENHRVVGLDPADPFVVRPDAVSPSRPYPEKQNRGMGGAKAAHALYKDEEVATTLTGKAADWVRARPKDKPFFLYLATTNIHHPFTPHPRFKGTSECGRYGDFIHELDWVVGEILKTLDERKCADNTLVIFTSDNGGMLNEGGKDAWRAGHRLNGKLLGFKFGAWEGGQRVPFLVRWPGKVRAGAASDQLIANIDLTATVAAMLGYTLKNGEAPDSFNVLPALAGNAVPPVRDHVVVAANLKKLGLREGRWMYVEGQGSGGFGNGLGEIAFTKQENSDVTLEGKVKPNAPPAQLYDLEADPYQTKNVYREHPETAARLQKRLAAIRAAKQTRP